MKSFVFVLVALAAMLFAGVAYACPAVALNGGNVGVAVAAPAYGVQSFGVQSFVAAPQFVAVPQVQTFSVAAPAVFVANGFGSHNVNVNVRHRSGGLLGGGLFGGGLLGGRGGFSHRSSFRSNFNSGFGGGFNHRTNINIRHRGRF